MQSGDSRSQALPESPVSQVIQIGPLTLDPEGFTLTVDDQDLSLTYAEFLLMTMLLRNPYQVLNRQQLSAVLRDGASAVLGARGSSLRSVDTHISRMRTKLRALGYDCIKTMRFVGYRFIPPEKAGAEAAHKKGRPVEDRSQ